MRKGNSAYWLYGRHSVISALENSSRVCKRLIGTKSALEELKSTAEFKHKVSAEVMTHQAICKVTGLHDAVHQGIALFVETLCQPSIDELLKKVNTKKTSCVVILDQVTDPNNVGAIIRSALAFSVDAIIAPQNQAAKESSALVKASSGAFEKVPMIDVVNLASAIKQLKSSGYWVIGLSGNAKEDLSSLQKYFDGKIAIVLGSEGSGMRRLTSENCDLLAKITISSEMESLNISCAAAIALYEISRFDTANK